MKRSLRIIAVMLFLGLISNAHAGAVGDDTLDAVVRIKSLFPADGDSTAELGRERTGNGVVIDAEGTILTLSFLTWNAEKIEVMGPDKQPVAASLIGYDPNTGFSLLRTDKPLGITPLILGQSSALAVGDRAIAAGAGGDRELQLTQVVSRREFAGAWEYLLEDAIFVAPAFEDFSGAALMNSKGQLVGLGYLFLPIIVQGHGFIPCNMFIPIDTLRPVLADLKDFGRPLKPRRPWLGIHAEESHGRIFITKVTAGSPAEKAGLQVEDMIVSVDGKVVKGLADFYRKIWGVGDAGVPIPLSVLRGDKIREMKVLSADRYQQTSITQEKDMEF